MSIWMMTLDHRDFPVAKAKWDTLRRKREERGRREGKEEERKEGERGKRKRDTLKESEGTPALMACLHQENDSLWIIYNAYLSKGFSIIESKYINIL